MEPGPLSRACAQSVAHRPVCTVCWFLGLAQTEVSEAMELVVLRILPCRVFSCTQFLTASLVLVACRSFPVLVLDDNAPLAINEIRPGQWDRRVLCSLL